ncbi:hypothetical protein ACERK3_00760 [Phycisphaerales bacterium AB-hyl4]|uniref:PH (Pleckstrin Homology) domain-containing protein n=1 Tax=Natronomicrosphaera hydrolytica TaxID=3242702 RepID=A0ABV4TZW6_9BACT
MAAKASISSGYRWRLGIIAAALLLFGSAFVYDAAVTWEPLMEIRRSYPERQRIYQQWEQVQLDHDGDAAEANRAWAAIADAEGYPDRPSEYTDRDIFIQWVCAAITLPLGLLFAVSWVRTGSRWIATDDTGLHTSWGQHAPWPTLRSIDKSRWKAKGIAVVHYDDNGSERRITLDDWKYDREPTAEMLKEVEAQLGETDPATTEPEPVATAETTEATEATEKSDATP